MKLKKFLLFILVFIFLLFLSSDVKGYVLSEGGINKYYLEDLPFDDSVYKSVFLLDSTNNIIYLLQSEGDSYNFCYESRTDRIYLFDNNRNRVGFNYYTCTLDSLNGVYVGSSWGANYTSNWKTIDKNYVFIGGTGLIYPGLSSTSNHLVTSLPTGINWGDNFLIGIDGGSLYLFAFNKLDDYVLTCNTSNNYVYYRPSYDSSDYLSFSSYTYDYDNSVWTLGNNISSTKPCVYSLLIYYNQDILNSSDGSVLFESPSNIFKGLYEYNSFPYILNSAEDLAKGNDDIIIMPGDFKSTEDIYFGINLETTEGDTTRNEDVFTVCLNSNSPYFRSIDDSEVGFYYSIPFSDLENILIKNNRYGYYLNYEYGDESYVTDFIWATYGGLTEEDKVQNAISEQTKVMEEYYKKQEEIMQEQQATAEEQLETSKGIWGTLKDVLNFINPLSEDFFVYKLIDLLVDALKSLFIPGDNFLSDYFNELLEWFSDRLGFLSYPLELILDLLDRILNIDFEEPIIQIPDILEPFTNKKLISNTTFNFNSLLSNNTLKACHEIYLIIVDSVIVFGLVNLLKNKMEEVFTK